MGPLLFRNLAVLDTVAGELRGGLQVLVQDGRIASVAPQGAPVAGARVVDLGGRTLMPGMIDLHVHVMAPGRGRTSVSPDKLPSYVDIHSTLVMREFLMRGFTTVRDAAGADRGHKMAVEDGLVTGPRMFVSGRAISQTGGHGDPRSRGDLAEPCVCCAHLNTGCCRIADGEPDVRKAARDEIRLGADQIKVMASGGVVSESDPIDYVQYSMAELTAIVDEAERANTYVLAHAYTGRAIERCVEAGIRTIEHGNFLDEKSAKMMAAAGAYLVPTLVAYQVLVEMGKQLNLTPAQWDKVNAIVASGTRSIEIAQRYGVKMGLGTDLVVRSTVAQPRELTIRAQALRPADILRSATVIGAEVVRIPGKLGVIAEGAFADMLVVDGDPLADLSLLGDEGLHLSMIMKGGRIHKDGLGIGP
ncbi:MAG: amidohydrolase family protein [Alphaproteobacteria bacterium]|nr:amidohydrolase family protein [Alphaproteobacteria bacterium]